MAYTVLITGAGRGLGLEFVRQYAADGWEVVATVRDPARATALHALPGVIEVVPLTVDDGDSVAALAATLAGRPLDLLINNAGLYGSATDRFGHLDYAGWAEVLAVNTLGPVRVTEALLPALRAGRLRRVVSITSLMGSIQANTSGGALYYRSSKAALNAAMKTLSLDLRREGLTLVVMHPGWVRTDMGGPNAPLEPRGSIAAMRQAIDHLSPADSGRFLNYDGTDLVW